MKELKYIKGNLLEIAEISIIGHQDKTIWNFRNINTNELFSGTQYQFINKYGIKHGSIGALLAGRLQTLKGWKIEKSI